jgi:hypothetical protein
MSLQSSANDLAKYTYSVWLQQTPSVISPFDRRRSLKPVYSLLDGKQQVGPGWEIGLRAVSTSSNTSNTDKTKTYSTYGKSGSGGGWQSYLDIVPNLGYGLIILSQTAGLDGYTSISPSTIDGDVHDILIPAFAEALTTIMEDKYAGTYRNGEDTGISSDVVSIDNPGNATTYARLEVADQMLYMRELVVNGSSALEAIDRVSWSEQSVEERFFSRPAGVVLEPAGGANETAEFGEGSQVFRMALAGVETCDWYDYDGLVICENEGSLPQLLTGSGTKT